MSNYTPPQPDLPPEVEDMFTAEGLDPNDYIFSLGDIDQDPDIRPGGFATIENAINYLTEQAALLAISRLYYDYFDDSWYVAIPDNTE